MHLIQNRASVITVMAEVTIDCLPTEVLFIIFRLLGLKELLSAKNVSRHWRRLIVQLLDTIKEVQITDLGHRKLGDRCGNFNIHGLNKRKNVFVVNLMDFKTYRQNIHSSINHYLIITNVIETLRSLRVIYLCLLNDPHSLFNMLDMINDNCHSELKHLTLICRGRVYLGFNEVVRFCKKFPNLRNFQFEATELDLCGKAMAYLLKNLTRLETFIVMDSIHCYERKLRVLNCPNDCSPYCIRGCKSKYFSDVSPHIRVVKVSGDLMNSNALQSMADCRMDCLLNLHVCSFDGIEAVQMIADKFRGLLSLTLSSSYGLRSPSEGDLLMSSVSRLTQLRKFHLFLETDRCIFTYESISKLKACSRLTSFQMESTCLKSECVESITRFLPQITKLDLTYIQFECNSSQSICWIANLKNLQCLKLSASPELEDASTVPIVNKCQFLSHLDFSRSDFISELTFKACLQSAVKHPETKMTAYFASNNKTKITDLINTELSGQIPSNLVLKFPVVKYI